MVCWQPRCRTPAWTWQGRRWCRPCTHCWPQTGSDAASNDAVSGRTNCCCVLVFCCWFPNSHTSCKACCVILLLHSALCQLQQRRSPTPDLIPLICMLQEASTNTQTDTKHTPLTSTSTAAAASCTPLSCRAAAQPHNCAQARHRRVPPKPPQCPVYQPGMPTPPTPCTLLSWCYPPAHKPAAYINSQCCAAESPFTSGPALPAGRHTADHHNAVTQAPALTRPTHSS